jgi:endothelin-converting enzyme/putative endopeptidase
MDEAAIEAAGSKPIEPELAKIAALQGKDELPRLLAGLHASGVAAVFRFGSFQDFKDATQSIAAVDQGGLGLPDRDYYLKDDARSTELRGKYRDHVRNTFRLLGDTPEAAAQNAERVVAVETELARASLERVKRRDPDAIYHKLPLQDLKALAPAFAELNVTVPDFFKGLEAQLRAVDLEGWKTYLRWHVARAAAPALSSAFVDENFDFFGRTLTGAKALRARWKRCVQAADDDLGEALGQPYVASTFGADGKQRMLRLVAALEQALERDIRGLSWMTPETRLRALEKLAAISNKVGYPDEWRDYSRLAVRPDDFLGNRRRAEAFELARDLAKIGRPVDRKEWRISPPTVNAYYEPGTNSINFPAGILQPPFFDRAMDDAVNFGAIGAVIGHELTHGFDDQGRKFAPDGNLRDWWSEADAKEFERRAQCFVDQYAGYSAVEDVKLNGRLTLGENTADNGGLRIALMALQDTSAGRNATRIDGFTPEQRLFLGWAQIWCSNSSPEALRLQALTNPHSPGQWRVNGVVANMPEFQQAFSCQPAAAMVRGDKACRVW